MTLFENILKISTDVPVHTEASAGFVERGEKEWKEALDKAGSEGLIAFCLPGAKALGCPKEILKKWTSLSQEIRIISEINRSQTALAAAKLEEAGLKAIPLKGAALANYYPEPELRLYQDIDIWVKGDRAQTITNLKSAGYRVSDILSHECKINLGTGVGADIHFTPQKFNNPFLDRKLKEYFNRTEAASTEFYLVYSLCHSFRHAINNHLSWKNVLDYHFLLKSASPGEMAAAKAEIVRLGMKNFACDLCGILSWEFGDETDDFFSPGSRGGLRLRKELRGAQKTGQSTMYQSVRKTIRIASFFFLYPGEVFFSPYSRTKQFIWRKIKKF